MRTILLAGWTLVGLLGITGCSSVTSLHPVGTPVAAEQGKKLDGAWLTDDNVFYLKYLANGKLRIAGVEWKDDQFKLHTMEGFFGQDDGIYYLSVKNDGKDQSPPTYTFVRLAMPNKRTLVVFPPHVEAFQKAVQSGHLTGEVDGEEGDSDASVRLQGSKKQVDDFIDGNKAGEQFDLDSPLVLKRLGKLK